MTAEGIGIVFGSLIVMQKRFETKEKQLIQFGLFAISVSLCVIAATNTSLPVLGASLLLGIGAAGTTIGLRTTIQPHLPKELLGRAFVSISFLVSTLRMISISIASILAASISLRIIYWICAFLIFFAAILASVCKFRIREDRKEPPSID